MLIPIPKEPTNRKKFEDFKWEFDTFGDKTLVNMLNITKDYCDKLINKREFKFLTLCGPTGVGKTHLLSQSVKLFKSLNLLKYFSWRSHLDYPYVMFVKWYQITPMLFDKKEKQKFFKSLERCGILVLEEFLKNKMDTSNAYKELEVETAHEVLDLRLKKPLMIDCNKYIEEIQDIDVRIADRLYRNNGRVIKIPKTTLSYQKRIRQNA